MTNKWSRMWDLVHTVQAIVQMIFSRSDHTTMSASVVQSSKTTWVQIPADLGPDAHSQPTLPDMVVVRTRRK